MSKNAKNVSKGQVLSFRITHENTEKIRTQLEKSPIVKCDSAQKFARKLCLDWLAGRLAYKNPAHLDVDSEIIEEMESIKV